MAPGRAAETRSGRGSRAGMEPETPEDRASMAAVTPRLCRNGTSRRAPAGDGGHDSRTIPVGRARTAVARLLAPSELSDAAKSRADLLHSSTRNVVRDTACG